MNVVDYIAIAVIALIVGASLYYIIRAKKRGEKCIGCPYAKQCAGSCSKKTDHTKSKKDNGKQ